jgi:hypothetical protein
MATKVNNHQRDGAGRFPPMDLGPARRIVAILVLAVVVGAIGYSAVPFRTAVPAGRSGQCVPAALAIFIQGDADSQTGSWLKYGYCANAAKPRLATSGVIASLAIVFGLGTLRALRAPEGGRVLAEAAASN